MDDGSAKNGRGAYRLVAFGVILFVGLLNLSRVLGVARVLLGMVSFFILGLSFAFILNVPMRMIEEKALAPLARRLGPRFALVRRPLALVITIVLVLAVATFAVFMVIPELVRTFTLIGEALPGFIQSAGAWLGSRGMVGQDVASYLQSLNIDWEGLAESILTLLRQGAGSVLSGTVSAATSLVAGAFNAVIGLILSLYILMGKERLGSQARQVVRAYLRPRKAEHILSVASTASRIFSAFIGGQFLEAAILGLMFFIGMSLIGFPFAPMVSVLVGVTAFIPIFGAFIGCIVGAFMILVNEGVLRAVWFVIFFIVLQQVEGNFIYPHVVGKSVELPGLWVLAAVTLGGNLAGILGMLVGVPVSALLYALLREAVQRRNAVRAAQGDTEI